MFHRLKSHFTRQSAAQKKSSAPPPETMRDCRGYFRPQSTDELLATPQRRQYLQQLWQNSALPEGLYQRFYLAPMKQLLGSVQQVPATPEGDWSGSGGFADLTLKFTTCAVRLAKGHLLPPGAAPETQAAQSLLWQAVVFWRRCFTTCRCCGNWKGNWKTGIFGSRVSVFPTTLFVSAFAPRKMP
ncbi:TraI domain-containing protein [Xenorhabdus khoisanae]|uniref:TraI domain-containing protein n=1 Tax=Xenorhabdus khoisanae TaxID=880157 RepID=UPI002358A178|nr:TraI domain-containing protein [Xenorhabdus khoisanae]MDC9615005.1 TraI domain-containing protein [Xenorhabdus khoisanae]